MDIDCILRLKCSICDRVALPCIPALSLRNMLVKQIRSSTTFAVIVVCVAVFTDIFLYGLVVPMLPFALAERVGLTDADIQRWNSILLASYGASIMLGSCTCIHCR